MSIIDKDYHNLMLQLQKAMKEALEAEKVKLAEEANQRQKVKGVRSTTRRGTLYGTPGGSKGFISLALNESSEDVLAELDNLLFEMYGYKVSRSVLISRALRAYLEFLVVDVICKNSGRGTAKAVKDEKQNLYLAAGRSPVTGKKL